MNLDSATKRNPFQHLSMSASKTNSILRDSPPFRSGGRGSKQVAAALERTADSPQIQTTEKKYAFFDGRSSPCFVKIVNEKQFGGVLVQPLRANPLDPNFYIPWDGHLWIAMRSKLHPIEMRVHSQGLEVVSGPPVMHYFLSKGKDNGFRYPMTTQQRTEQNLSNEVDDNWDVISLESGETLSAIPKHPIPMPHYHSQPFKPPGEIYIGNSDNSHTMKTPMVKMRAFPPLPPTHTDRNNSSSSDTNSSANYTRGNHVGDGVNSLDLLKTLPSNLVLGKEAAVAAAAAAAAMASSSTSVPSDESEEFLKIVQIAYTLYKGQKASQQSQLSTQPLNTITSDGEFLLSQGTTNNAITPIESAKQPPSFHDIPTEGMNDSTVLSEVACEIPCGIQPHSAGETSIVQTPAQDKEQTETNNRLLPNLPATLGSEVTTTPSTQSNLPLEETESEERKQSTTSTILSPSVANVSEYARVAKRRLDLSDASPDSVSGVLISPMLTPNQNTPISKATNDPDPERIDESLNHSNQRKHKKRNVKQSKASSQDAIVSNTPEPIDDDLKRTALETTTVEVVGTSLPPRPPRVPKPSPKSKVNSNVASQEQTAEVDKLVPVLPTVGTKRSRKEAELAALLLEATSSTVSSTSSSSSRKRRQIMADDPPSKEEISSASNTSVSETQDTKSNSNNNNVPVEDRSNNSRSNRLDVGIAILDSTTPRYERRVRGQTQQSAIKQRDAFLGSWPNRKQSAASGHWRI